MKLKTAVYIVLGFILSWILSSSLDINQLNAAVLALLVPVGILHELLHFTAISILGIEYRFVVKGLYVGFFVSTNEKRKYFLAALFPQVLTIAMLASYILTLNRVVLTLSILHIAISIEDIGRCIKRVVS